MRHAFKNKAGLILAEALLAISMLVMGVLVMSFVIDNAISTTTLSRNYLIAQNLATEAIEAVKSVRDTNWLLQSNEPACWLELKPDSTPGCTFKVAQGRVYIPTAAAGKWALSLQAGELALPGGINGVYMIKLDGNNYVQGGGTGENSIFYRSIKATDVTDDSATFEVKLQWMEGQKVRTILRSFILYNYN